MNRVGLAVCVALVAITCLRLGVWQLDRLGQRRDRNAVIAARAAQSSVEVRALTGADSLAFRRAVARGTFDVEREVVEVLRSVNGVPGVHVVTPLRLEGGEAVLVQRGWVPSPDARTVDLAPYRVWDTVVVRGILLRPRPAAAPRASGWPLAVRDADPAALATRFPYPLSPWILRLDREAGGPGLQAIPMPELTDGPHLGYALQWFGFAVVAVVGGGILLRHRRAGGAPAADPRRGA